MTHHPDPIPRKAYHQWMAAGSAFAKAVIRDSEREEPMDQGKSKGVSNYEIIDSGICPKCRGKMRSSDHTENNGFNWYCDHCQLLYKFHDDPGPGAYSTINLKPIPNAAEEPMNQVDGCCQHGELLHKYCPECFKEDVEKELLEAEKKEFSPEEGDRILVGLSNRAIGEERTFLYINKRGDYMCVHADDEDCYNRAHDHFRVASWPYAKPLPPKLPEFIQGDPIIVWMYNNRKTKWFRIVHSVANDGSVKCFHTGPIYAPESRPIPYSCYKLLPGYNYGGRDVWGSEDNNS